MSVSTYVLTDGGSIILQYPWSIDQMILSNPTVSFSVPVSDEIAAQFNTFPVLDAPQPEIDPLWQNIAVAPPSLREGQWFQEWSVTVISPEEHDARVAAYRAGLSCTPLQGKIELENRGLLDAAEAGVAAADKITKLAWSNATIWYRTSPMIEALGAGLGLSLEDLDNLFAQAAKITV